MKTISIKGILEDLENGLTRTTTSQGYDEAIGSIETKYELTKAEVKEMFQHELLKNRKTKKAPSFRLIDDVTAPAEDVQAGTPTGSLEITSEPAQSPKVGYGTRPASQQVSQESASLNEVQVTSQSQF